VDAVTRAAAQNGAGSPQRAELPGADTATHASPSMRDRLAAAHASGSTGRSWAALPTATARDDCRASAILRATVALSGCCVVYRNAGPMLAVW
jgi:hypothetical protein